MYTPLGIKTDYSLLRSLIKIEDLISHAQKNNYPALGILDDNLCSSHIFYEQCKKNRIKPIIGLDTTVDEYRMYLYPKNERGLKSLFRFTREKLDRITTLSDLKMVGDEVICVLPLESKAIFEEISKLFKDVFIAFEDDKTALEAKLISNRTVFIKSVLALNDESSRYVNYLYMIEHNLKLGDIELKDYRDCVLKKYDYDTSDFTDLIDIEFTTGNVYIPHFSDDISDSEKYLRTLAYKGLEKRLNGQVLPKYKERLDYELDVISKMGFTDYFLIVFDYVRFAIKNDIYVGAGRGSAAGSLVAYSLGITWIDPLKYDLLFERFLNPERVTMPDIDVDFEYERRDEVVEYVKERYGIRRVARIMTYGTMTAKEVLRVIGKINDIDDTTLNVLTSKIDSKISLEKNLTNDVRNILKKYPILSKVYREARYLEGIKKHIGTHAAGVVISSKNLEELIPIIKSGDEYLTGYTMNELEELGLLKMDFLSIKNLTILTNVLKDIARVEGVKININAIPLDDKAVYELFSRGDTVGVFQFESTGMKNFLRRLKPNSFADLVMAIAIYRPGPMQSIDTYIRRKNGTEKIVYIDDSLESILKPTYGILIYQEQIMEILRFMGNYSYAEADIIRRAISKKKLDVIESERKNFIDNAINNGYKREIAEEVYNLIVRFADFGFNKSHSVAYAMIAYQMAYLKTHYREHYYINLLNINIGGEAKTKEYIDEVKQSGVQILRPDVNKSQAIYSKEGKSIRLPLRVIKGVGTSSNDAIIERRGKSPFSDYFDFVARTYGFNVNKKTLEALVLGGALDSFGYNRRTLLNNLDSALMYADLVANLDASLVNKPEIEIVDEFLELELMQTELKLYGYYVSTHPASKYPKVVKMNNIKKYFDKYIETVVLIENIRVVHTKNGKDMAFLRGSDETTSADFVLFPDRVSFLDSVKSGDLVWIKGHVERRFDKYQIVINNMKVL